MRSFKLAVKQAGSIAERVSQAVVTRNLDAVALDEEARGAIYTRREVVDFILDLVGYVESKPLHTLRLLEPSFGGGDFLLPAVRRLIRAWRAAGGGDCQRDLLGAIYAVEIHAESFATTKAELLALLNAENISGDDAEALTESWLHQGDFLLMPLNSPFDFVVGNPPYVRQELIPEDLLLEYRARYRTIYDRADLYIPFIERSLSVLKPGGSLGFICADRWMKNRYGGPLRKYVSQGFHLKYYVDMVDTPAFHTEVVAYPAITVISREKAGSTRIAHRPSIEAATLAKLANSLCAIDSLELSDNVRVLAGIVNGSEPWLLESSDQMALIRRLEATFPCLEDAGCKVGIGVATGADKAFIGEFDALDVEPSRKIRIVTTKDIMSGEVQWKGLGVVNPFENDGRLAAFVDYPRMAQYFEARREVIAKRHVAQKIPANWYRTIDRITPSLAAVPKLLIPDIKGEAHVVFEPGGLYPHHNLYYVTSEQWSLRALQAVLLSAVTRLFIATYSTKMRGGFLRFQAQYLRRVRLPAWGAVPAALRAQLEAAAVSRDIAACNRAVFELYGLSVEERSALGGSGDNGS